MAKVAKKAPLTVGQRVYIETYGGWVETTRTLTEYEIIQCSQSSAWGVRVEDLPRYSEVEKNYPHLRIDLKTHAISNNMFGQCRRLWLTKEAFEQDAFEQVQLKKLKKQAHSLVDNLTKEQLEQFLQLNA